MKNHILARSAALFLIIGGLALTCFVLPFSFGHGIVLVLPVVYLISVFLVTGVFLLCRLNLKLLIYSLILGGFAELVIGLIFLSTFSLEIKLFLVNVFLASIVVVDRYYAKTRRSSAYRKLR
ncbi:MAG: hypothetical protein QXJ02_00550 [Candidatus Bathyarchaeia archaeon]